MNKGLRILALLIVGVALVAALVFTRGRRPIEVPVTKVTRETLISTLSTNGKVEPIESAAIRAEASGAVQSVHVERGQPVQKGALIVILTSAAAQSELDAAQAGVMQARAELETLGGGGRAAEQAEIETGLARARAELANVRREVEALQRLVDKKAAPPAELTAAKEKVQALELQIAGYERKRSSLVTAADKTAAQARLQGAQSRVSAALKVIESARIRAPMSGVVYDLAVRAGSFVHPGDLIAQVGRLDQLRVIVYVDEPELGRVEEGMPVRITWDALPGREWVGKVEKVPLQVVPLGTRQVGEVICTIDNPETSLIPGTNINAEIRSSEVQRAMTLPKEALRREGNETGVLKVEGDRAIWRKVRAGVSSVTRIEIVDGLSEGDVVVLPTDRPLKSGDPIRSMGDE